MNKAWNLIPSHPLPTTKPGSFKLLFLLQPQPGGEPGKERDPPAPACAPRARTFTSKQALREESLRPRTKATEPANWAPAHSTHCSGEGCSPSSTKAAKIFTLPAFLCKREGASLAGLQGAAVVNANPKGSTGRRVCENGPYPVARSPPLHTIQAKPALKSFRSPPRLMAKTLWWQWREQFQWSFHPLPYDLPIGNWEAAGKLEMKH